MNSTPQQIMAECERRVLRGLTAGAITLTGFVKETLSVPAPRRRAQSRNGTIYYRATTPATKGAPPRKLSGRLRASIGYQILPQQFIAKVGTNVVYGRRHEYGTHPYLAVTLQARYREVADAMTQAMLAP